jgi:4,5-DOPA dioxygenase extradiol
MNRENQSMPSIFMGHGSPMNIIDDNQYTQNMDKVATLIEKPRAIMCVSAHWITDGTQITQSEKPKQIYDFGGFPKELYNIKYEPLGAPELVGQISKNDRIQETSNWGLDHGTWSVLHHMFPKQDIPVFQLSLNKNFNVGQHLELARELKNLAGQKILCLGSGNIVHNLQKIQWDPKGVAESWAIDFEKIVLEVVSNLNLSSEQKLEKIFNSSLLNRAHPTIEHLLPLVYALGTADESKTPNILIQGIQNASISMASIIF